jgi:hypothetical protein
VLQPFVSKVASSAAGGAAAKPKAKDERGLVKILVEECLKSRAVWLFAISYFL